MLSGRSCGKEWVWGWGCHRAQRGCSPSPAGRKPLAHSRSQVPGHQEQPPPSPVLPASHKGWLCPSVLPGTLPMGTGLDTLKQRVSTPGVKPVQRVVGRRSVGGLSLPLPFLHWGAGTFLGHSGSSLPGAAVPRRPRRIQCPPLCPGISPPHPCPVLPTAPALWGAATGAFLP